MICFSCDGRGVRVSFASGQQGLATCRVCLGSGKHACGCVSHPQFPCGHRRCTDGSGCSECASETKIESVEECAGGLLIKYRGKPPTLEPPVAITAEQVRAMRGNGDLPPQGWYVFHREVLCALATHPGINPAARAVIEEALR